MRWWESSDGRRASIRTSGAIDRLPPTTRFRSRSLTYRYGDVRARMRVRMDEIHESIRLIREIRLKIPQGPIAVEPKRGPRLVNGPCRPSKAGAVKFCTW